MQGGCDLRLETIQLAPVHANKHTGPLVGETAPAYRIFVTGTAELPSYHSTVVMGVVIGYVLPTLNIRFV